MSLHEECSKTTHQSMSERAKLLSALVGTYGWSPAVLEEWDKAEIVDIDDGAWTMGKHVSQESKA